MSDAAARREARRRRILENSENRLRMISGAVTADVFGDLPVNVHDVPPLDREEITHVATQSKSEADGTFHNPIHDSPLGQKENLSSHKEASGEPFAPYNEKENGGMFQEEKESSSLIASILTMRLHLVGLAVLVRLLFSTKYSSLLAESIFVPLFTLTLVKHIGIIPPSSNVRAGSGMLNAALMLSGLPAQQIGLLMKVMGGMTDFILDFYMYFFSFIVLHVFLECTN